LSVLRVASTECCCCTTVRACCTPLCMLVLQFGIAHALGQCSLERMMLLSAACVFDWCPHARL
jgi:hypothetical protein